MSTNAARAAGLALAVAALAAAQLAEARITKVEITAREVAFGGYSWPGAVFSSRATRL